MMKPLYKFLLTVVFLHTTLFVIYAQDNCPIIPEPATAQRAIGHFTLHRNTAVVIQHSSMRPAAHFLQKEILRLTGIPLTTQEKGGGSSILFELDETLAEAEAYTLHMDEQTVRISANGPAGWLYGAVSFLQLANAAEKKVDALVLANWKIADQPTLGWRGLMLDESRHFFGKEKVKSILDWMAFYKLNRFHWHLTDEPAWRLEIKKYPLLTLIGGIGSFTDGTLPAAYYTQEDIHDIVAYAAERNITVIPEIDMPGHATAANRAYPEYSGGGTEDHPHFTFNPGKEETYGYLTDILRETNALFPSGLLHLGGDEVSFGSAAWKTNPDIQGLMAKEGLETARDVERYFMKRMADSVFNLNAKLLVWDELADADLPTENTIIFWWRQDKPEQLITALANGHQTVLCPRLPLYFDFVQDSTHRYGRKWAGGLFNPIEAVYAYDAEDVGASLSGSNNIIGIQGNVWSEPIPNVQKLDYLLFPRIAALSEAAWTPAKTRDFSRFSSKLQNHLPLYKRQGIYYYDPFSPLEHPEPVMYKNKRDLSVERN